MVFWLRRIIIAAAFIACCSCEKHPLGQYPEVQREQRDPATRIWSEESETDKSEQSGERSTSPSADEKAPTPAEFFSPAKSP